MVSRHPRRAAGTSNAGRKLARPDREQRVWHGHGLHRVADAERIFADLPAVICMAIVFRYWILRYWREETRLMQVGADGSHCALALVFVLFSFTIARGVDKPMPARQVQVTDSAANVRHGALNDLKSGRLTLITSEQLRLATRDLVMMKFTDRTSLLSVEDPLVFLSGGDVLAMRPEKLDDESLTGRWVQNANWPACKIPLETVRGVIFEPPAGVLARARL